MTNWCTNWCCTGHLKTMAKCNQIKICLKHNKSSEMWKHNSQPSSYHYSNIVWCIKCLSIFYSIRTTTDSITEVFIAHMASDTGSTLVFQVKPHSVVKTPHRGMDTNSSISTELITAIVLIKSFLSDEFQHCKKGRMLHKDKTLRYSTNFTSSSRVYCKI